MTRSGHVLSILYRAGFAIWAAGIVVGGCSTSPDRVAAPAWDPSGMADDIMEDLDKNADGKLDADELAGAPGVAAGAQGIDADADGLLTREELEARFERYRTSRVGLRSQSFRLTYNGRPVADAEVTFLPEWFLEGIIEPAQGITDTSGIVAPQTEGQTLQGVRIGFYRVQITSSPTAAPEKYKAADSPLGADVSLGDDASYGAPVELKLVD